MAEELFPNRRAAGIALAQLLSAFRDQGALVLGLPRGGVPVAYEVAAALRADLDIVLVRKLGVPGQRELAMGAIASGGVRVLNERVIHALQIPRIEIDRAVAREEAELARRARVYRGDRPFPSLDGRVVIIVDDGLATGASMHAAAAALRASRPSALVVAVPVAAAETCAGLAAVVDHLACARMPEPFQAVGNWYDDFRQTSDTEVRELLVRAWQGGQALSTVTGE